MKMKSVIAALLLLVAGLQTAWGQGFRVYKSDGTVAQFSLRTDSIVFFDGIGSDQDFGPFTPVNQCIAGTWNKTKNESVTFNEDGTTDYMQGATYEFLPYQGTVIIYNASGAPAGYFKVLKVTAEQMIVVLPSSENFSVWSRTRPVQLVTSIVLSETTLNLQLDETIRLTATVLPADADNPAVTWESSNESVAEVNSVGQVTAKADGTCVITCAATDGSGVKAECQVTVTNAGGGDTELLTCPDDHHPHAISLGLPSGTKWSCCNLGASTPEGNGDYYAWGETSKKSVYNEATYQYFFGPDTDGDGWIDEDFSVVEIGTDIAGTDYDAATVNMGTPWRMPSFDQIRELKYYCSTRWTQQNGVSGTLVTGPNGGQIFLPPAGYRWNAELVNEGNYGFYWSSSRNPDTSSYAFMFFFYKNAGNLFWDHYNCASGRPVRAVRP